MTETEPPSSGDASTELEVVRPYIELARAIHAEVVRVVEDDAADADSLVEAIELIPRQERARVARAVFELLPADQQWSIIERVFDDDDIRRYLAEEHTARLDRVRQAERQRTVIARARADRRLDLEDLPPGEVVNLGLFRPADVRAAVDRGHESSVCARLIVLRSTDRPGELRLIDDVYNPRRGLFVTADYDEAVWRSERLASHESVRLGSRLGGPGGDALETVVYPGARLDVEVGGAVHEGRLHVGYVMIGTEDVFAA